MLLTKTLLVALLLQLLILNPVLSEDPKKKDAFLSKDKPSETATDNSKNTQLVPTETPKDTKDPKDEGSAVASKPQVSYFIFTDECLNKFASRDIDMECIKFSISKLLSLGIIAGSFFYKAPQILKIISAGSVEGLSISSFYSHLLIILIAIGYNIHLGAPRSTYAENFSIMIQTAILIFLIWKYNPKSTTLGLIGTVGLFTGIGTIMFLDILPDLVYQGIGIIRIVLELVGFIPQIRLNYQNKSTGQLAFSTTFLAWAGGVARIFTTFHEVKDPLLLIFFVIGSVLGGVLLLQFFLYKGKEGKVYSIVGKIE